MTDIAGAFVKELCARVAPVDESLLPGVRAHLDDLTKPKGSLGRLEEIAERVCLIQNTTRPRLGKKVIATFAGDHGIAARGVSAYPASVTPQMVLNMLGGGAAVNVLARHAGADLHVIDVGVNDPFDGAENLVREKIAPGTADMTAGPAMTIEQATAAMAAGVRLADSMAEDQVLMAGTGEMGIGNTTAASALMAALLPVGVAKIVGRGTGLSDEGVARKKELIETALSTNRDALGTPLTALAAVGGFEIAGITGFILAAASHRMVVVVDGFISSAAALVAERLCPGVRDYLVFGHLSDEAGHRAFFDAFSEEPLLQLGMRLGEGTGAALAMQLVEAAVKIYSEMATFSSASVDGPA